MMRDRLGNSPREAKFPEPAEINFKKSPQKYALCQPTQHTHPAPHPTQPAFHNVRKVHEETAALRQTMNYKLFARLQQAQVPEDDAKAKLNDFLRQTIGAAKSARISSETLIPDEAYSAHTNTHAPYYNNHEPYRPHTRTTSTLNDPASLRQYEKLSEKIDRNRQLIHELKATNQQARQGREGADRGKEGKEAREGKEGREGREGREKEGDLLRNVNHHRSPTYLHIDYQREQEPLQFAKKTKKDDPANYFTPKPNKAKPDSRFSSPLEKAKSSEKEPTIGNFSSISSLKKKSALSAADEFAVGRKLGEGKFGSVHLARHRLTNGLFALKKIPKALIRSNLMVDQLALEIRIQSCIKHPAVLELYGCFHDTTHLYLVLEYMDGGTLYERCKRGRLGEAEAAGVVRQVAQAIDCLHDLGVAHRDVKPENVVLSGGVYKLCDFGWAALCNERRKTYCGTFDYVAPEILQGVEYDMTVDLWCLGVLTFELLTGRAPFYHVSRKETMKRILNVENDNIVFPEGLSEAARDFIEKLIRKDPAQRIRTAEALLHPFLAIQQEDS